MKDKKSNPLGSALLFPAGSLKDPDIIQAITRFRKQVAGRYQALSLDNLKRVLTEGPFHVSPKIDGELWFLVATPKQPPILVTTTGRMIEGELPLLTEVSGLSGVTETTVIAGELYVLSKEDRPRVGMLSALMADGKDAEVKRIGFMAFDVVSGKSADALAYADRFETLQALLEGGKRCKPVPTELEEDASGVSTRYGEWADGGKAEGLVVRDAAGRILKIKPSFSFDVAVIAFTDSREDPQQVGSVLMALMRDDGSFQLLGGCGNLGTTSACRALHSRLMENVVESDMRHASGSGALYRFVKPEIVLEVTVTDVQAENAAGQPIRNRILNFTNGRWETLQYLPGASLLHPALTRVREDKSVNEVDVRLSQLTERCQVPDLEAKAEKMILPESAIIRREVYTKVTKGKTGVRKLLMWKTNKEDISGDFPAYVVSFIDYSADRKDPLKREVRLAPSEEIAAVVAEDMLASNIKKGWEKVD